MANGENPDIFRWLQPELLAQEELKEIIGARCPRVQNLSSASKEQLVKLFRQVVLPLPQRNFPENRWGKILTARRRRAGLEANREEEARTEPKQEKCGVKRNLIQDRLKPPPDVSKLAKVRMSSNAEEKETPPNPPPSGRKIVLKRTNPTATESEAKNSTQTSSKVARKAIQWPT